MKSAGKPIGLIILSGREPREETTVLPISHLPGCHVLARASLLVARFRSVDPFETLCKSNTKRRSQVLFWKLLCPTSNSRRASLTTNRRGGKKIRPTRICLDLTFAVL